MKLWPGAVIKQRPEKTIWHPVIYYNGRRRYITSRVSESGLVECDSMKSAQRYAEDHIKRIRRE